MWQENFQSGTANPVKTGHLSIISYVFVGYFIRILQLCSLCVFYRHVHLS